MRKLLNSPWFVTVLALAAVLLVGWSFLSAPKVPAPSPDVSAVPDESRPADPTEGEGSPRLSVVEALKALALPSTVRDPFALPPKPEAAEPDPVDRALLEVVDRLHLSASWVQGSAVFVLLNGHICHPGDVIDNFTIETADLAGAWVSHSGNRSYLPVGQELAVSTSVSGSPIQLSP